MLSKLERSCGAKRFGFNRKLDADVILLLVLRSNQHKMVEVRRLVLLKDLLQGGGHDLWPIVDGQNNICDTGGGQALNLVQNHWSIGEFD